MYPVVNSISFKTIPPVVPKQSEAVTADNAHYI